VLALEPKNSYTPGSTIVMSCSVQGYPEPNVTWIKDDVPLYNNERVQITCKQLFNNTISIYLNKKIKSYVTADQPHRLVLSDVTSADSGKYTCRASNAYTYANGEANVSIQCEFGVLKSNLGDTNSSYISSCCTSVARVR